MISIAKLGQLEQFERFHSSTYQFPTRVVRAIGGSKAHFSKAITLQNLAKRLAPNIDLDEAQMETQGFSPSANAHEICTVFEASILELYASLDCAWQVFVEAFSKARGMPTDSTRKLFLKLQDGKHFGAPFPSELGTLIADAHWYPRLLHLRDTLTHSDTGSLHKDQETGLLRYMHTSIKSEGKPLFIEDAFVWFKELLNDLNTFLGNAFRIMNLTLGETRVHQICGFVDGRILMREISYLEEIENTGGICMSKVWFEEPQNPTCPFKSTCPTFNKNA
tara:strand:- start:319 stop:1152 length:834 start_codon:yes stop_codon:yes gene_type:complete